MEAALVIFIVLGILVTGIEYGVYRINRYIEKMLMEDLKKEYERDFIITEDGEKIEFNEDEQE